ECPRVVPLPLLRRLRFPAAERSRAGSMAVSPSRRTGAALRRSLEALPARPGVYFFRDAEGHMIYIGKSVSLRDRVRSYFTGTPATRKLRRLRREIRSVDWQATGPDLGALLLESRLVKQPQPRFNTMLRGFRAATYIRLDWSDPFPRLEITRQPRVDGADYFGPFRSQDALEAAVSTVADALRLRTCQLPGHRLSGTRPCYRMEFGYCAAPCAAQVTVTEYRETVVEAAGIFGGQGESPLHVLEERMAEAAEHLRFETAARLRDALEAIRGASGRQQALQSAIRRLHLLAACPSVREDALSL